ncbi:hypothetical protein SLS56_004142 [Neofusicoccum ribis]|uniref:RRM domain-containing protein n=1 Tax=Neofusicoccum ribis TaxID=45134 RepID=A0ABR3SXW0_9PEZI
MAGRAKTDAKADQSKAAGPPPNQTLYCNNLPDKLPKKDLKRELYLLFSTYGSVLDIVTLKTQKMRGQAHIVFQDIPKATQAMRSLNDFKFYGKPMKIEYAKSKAHFIAKLDGTFQQPTTGAQAVPTAAATSSLQQSIFNNPPSSLPAPPTQNGVDSPASVDSTKRRLESAEAGDAKRTKIEQPPAEEEDDDEAEMEMDESD